MLAQLDAHANRRSRVILGLADGLEEYPQFKIFVNGVLSEQEVTLPAGLADLALYESLWVTLLNPMFGVA